MLMDSRKEAMETWAHEGFVGDSAEQSNLANAKALGGIAVLDQGIAEIEKYRLVEAS